MLKTFLAAVSLLAIALALLAVKLFFKKPFVHTDIAGNKQLEQRGIHCYLQKNQSMKQHYMYNCMALLIYSHLLQED